MSLRMSPRQRVAQYPKLTLAPGDTLRLSSFPAKVTEPLSASRVTAVARKRALERAENAA